MFAEFRQVLRDKPAERGDVGQRGVLVLGGDLGGEVVLEYRRLGAEQITEHRSRAARDEASTDANYHRARRSGCGRRWSCPALMRAARAFPARPNRNREETRLWRTLVRMGDVLLDVTV